MFKFIKKTVDRKKETPIAQMEPEAYMKAVEGGIIPYWVDKTLMEKTGIRDLLAENTHVVNKLTYDDACDCLKRTLKMIDMATYVSTAFHERSAELDSLSSTEAFANHLNDMKAGKTNEVFRVKHDFYSADTIRDLFIEAHEKAEIHEFNAPTDLEEAMSRLHGAIAALRPAFHCTFISIKCAALSAMAEMTGFKS